MSRWGFLIDLRKDLLPIGEIKRVIDYRYRYQKDDKEDQFFKGGKLKVIGDGVILIKKNIL